MDLLDADGAGTVAVETLLSRFWGRKRGKEEEDKGVSLAKSWRLDVSRIRKNLQIVALHLMASGECFVQVDGLSSHTYDTQKGVLKKQACDVYLHNVNCLASKCARHSTAYFKFIYCRRFFCALEISFAAEKISGDRHF